MDVSQDQSHNIKGFAILLIMIHNLVGLMLGIGCNEMLFSEENCNIFLANVFTQDAFWYIISYAGWIGVQVFFFLSGYGLTKKYGNKTNKIDYGRYIKTHLFKLWKLLIPVYILYFLLTYYVFKEGWESHNIKSAFAQLSFTINFLNYGENDFYLHPGVYWFFGAILQLYLFFLLIRKLSNKWLFVLCLSFLLIHYFIIYFVNDDMMKWVRHNFIGWGVPFILGILAARTNILIPKRLNYLICPCSFLILCACLTTKAIAPFVEVFTIIFLVSFSNLYTAKWSQFLGIISPSIFVIHPLIRMLYFNLFCTSNYPLFMTVIYVIPVIILSWLHHRLLHNKLKFTNIRLSH